MSARTRLLGACALTALAAMAVHGLLFAAAQTQTQSRAGAAPEIKHVFVVVLENEDAANSFGPASKAPYLAQMLRSQGAYLPNYYATAHLSLPNYIAMVSGQSPTIENQADCQVYHDVLPGLATSSGQVLGTGCVYPAGTTQTVANLLEDHGFTWKGYMEDMGASCRRPTLNSPDGTQKAKIGDQYAARHNPFVYFHAITDFPTCANNDVDYSRLAGDLRSAATTPNYAFITPNLCNDGHDAPCVDGRPGGLETANTWLANNVPAILASDAFKDHGLLIVTFDEASGDASACCGEQPGPNTINPGGPTPGPGGGKVGAVLLSPCINPGTVDETPYNHYSMLRSVESFFGLPYLGYSKQTGLSSFGDKAFTRPDCGSPPPRPDCGNRMRGTRKRDKLDGTEYGDRIFGFEGVDRLRGFGGVDCIRGGPDRDVVKGGLASDRLKGGGGADRIAGGPGRDVIRGGNGPDKIKARDGKRDLVLCGKGRDRVRADRLDRVKGCENVRPSR